jgi:anthranilate phosphoribosyltransferase
LRVNETAARIPATGAGMLGPLGPAIILAQSMTAAFAPLLNRLYERPAEPADVREAFEAILAGAWTPVQVAAFCVAIRMRGESAEIIAAAAQAMRQAMTPVEHDLPNLVDTCGTGGDGSQTINLSSAAAVVVAACGFPVAKHGNRSASSRCGSADVFEVLGIPLDVPISAQATVLRSAGIAFLYAPAHHPALRHAGQARKELGTRTLFNVLGPLANPARATHQLLGVYEDRLRPLLADALGALGVKRAWVVRSEDGLDEISPAAPTRVSELAEGVVRERTVVPEDFGVKRTSLAALAGGEAADNARAVLDILSGKPHPARDAVVLNAAAALSVASGDALPASASRAQAALETGAALRKLEQWKAAAQNAKAS